MNLSPDHDFRLTDRYVTLEGEVLVTGVQALVRLPFDQMRYDRANGHNTGAFVSGYQGSPLGGYDRELMAQVDLCRELDVVHRSGLNEELAATSVVGSQLVSTLKTANKDGVVGYWYGKGPGLDRAGDAIRHGNFVGASKLGGVLALIGDDPACKSSTLPSRSDPAVSALGLPLLDPATMQDVLDLGMHGIAMSRASGLWVGMRIVTSVADGTGIASVGAHRFRPVIPTLEHNGKPWSPKVSPFTLAPASVNQEGEIFGVRIDMALEYVRQNKLNQIIVNPADAWLGIVASGYNAELVLKTLRALGIDEHQAAALGIRILKLRAVHPFDTESIRELARGVKTLLVVEDKRGYIETLVRDALYSSADRPVVIGKLDGNGKTLVPVAGALTSESLLEPMTRVLTTTISEERLTLPRQRRPIALTIAPEAVRGAYFCSGCPHNTSTVVPEDSLVGMGIGCHGMVAGVDNGERGEFTGIAQMGGEGMHWVGMAPFVDTPHIFQNLGDGTFFHSGQLAIQAAISAGVNITYKILYNAAVAMTGGQDATGLLSVPQVAAKVMTEGAKEVVITTDEVEKYKGVTLAPGVTVQHRDDIVKVQERLRTIPGVTVLIHDQQCAAEKRRDRKRGLLAIPKERIVIDHRVCEGCGDCGVKSNCLSLEPLDTEFGRKTKIDQASCNIDMSCLKGDCPAFVSVVPSKKKGTSTKKKRATIDAVLPEPIRVVPNDMTVRMPGIGGTGVVTISQMLLTAAKIEGTPANAVDQTGLSQKAGPVLSTVFFGSPTPARVETALIFDILTSVTPANVDGLDPEWSHVVANTHVTPTGRMIGKVATASLDISGYQTELNSRSDAASNKYVNASGLTIGLLGNGLTANVFLLGVAYQAGTLPLKAESIERAIELNGTAVEANLASFRWGRQWVLDPAGVEAAAASEDAAAADRRGLEGLSSEALIRNVAIRRAELILFQNEAYAKKYVDFVTRVDRAEVGARGDGSFTATVAHQLHRVMAYKDEYEVARLLMDSQERIEDSLGSSVESMTWNLHPPMLRSLGMDKKLKFTPRLKPAIAALKPLKKLRGTPLDVFGYAEVRKAERALIDNYRALIESLLPQLAVDHARCVHIAGLVDSVRGFEGVKMRNLRAYESTLAQALASTSAKV
jgi:indolepyruvate ferredoxin oxidoreductase